MILTTPEGQQHGLLLGENVVGRSGDCTIRLDTGRTSRRHAKIEWNGQQARIMDLGSTNGTRVNGRRLEPNRYYPLSVGDQVDFGGGPCAVMPGMVSGAFDQQAASVSQPLGSPGPDSLPPEPAESRGRRLSWLAIAGLAALLVVVFALAVWWGLSRTRSEETAATASPLVVQSEVDETQAPPQPGAAPTTTLAPTPAQAAGAAVAAKPARSAQQATQGIGGLPPINATTMPNLITAFTGGIDPNLLAAMLGGTPIPGLPGGTPAGGATPGLKRYAPPKLRAPDTGSSYQREDAVIVLEWEPVQSLRANDYYWVMVFYKRGDGETAGGTWMKGASYRVPAWFLTQAQGRFEWQVVIAEATAPAEQGGKLRGAVSEPSERRWFSWQGGGGGEQFSPIPSPTYGG